MSFKGQIEARCPQGCEPFPTEVWSFVHGGQDEELRNTVIFRELNLLLCPHCEKPFFPDATYVYYEPALELMAFVMPESYRAKEKFWRDKMHEDYLAFQKILKELPVNMEPEIFFGNDDLGELLEKEDFRREEHEVMEAVGKELGLSMYRVSPLHARRHGIPAVLPYEGGRPTPAAVAAGIKKLLAANDRLTAYADYLKKAGTELPPENPS